MRIFKSKDFSRWATKEGIVDDTLKTAVDEMELGLVDADLGGSVFKKRVGVSNRGKSGGVRTLLAYKIDHKAFFIFGFAKNVRSNINKKELKALRALAKELLAYNEKKLNQAVEEGALTEVEV